jgi:hypothetical protein
MANRTRSGRLARVCGYALVILAVTACGCKKEPKEKTERHEPGIWFVHATDPHIFLPVATESTDKEKAIAAKQQEKNEKALSDMLTRSRSVPEGDGPPAFLVLTGDLGVNPCPAPSGAKATPAKPANPKPGATTSTNASEKPADTCASNIDPDKQIAKLASLLGASPLKDIYLVAGNNDIAAEDPSDDALLTFNKLLEKVQTKITEDKSNVQLHNLTRCYDGKSDSSSCVADVNDRYRLIGFPSYSFKNKERKDGNLKAQEKQFDIFRGLLAQAGQSHKKVLVLSHVPEIDDPFTLAQDRYSGVDPGNANDPAKDNARSRWSTWNVSKKLLDDWYTALASDSVEAVLAGHLHDSHREAYRPPYSWSTLTSQRGGFQKLLLAPPLAVKNQDDSPIQARGFSLIHLERDRVRPLLYWYNSETGDFKAEQHHDFEEREHHGWWHCPRFIKWAWGLDQSDSQLMRLAVLLIALLTAFLTVVAIWQIPPAKDLLADSTVKTVKDKKEEQPAADASPLASRFGKTVLAGLGGLVMAEVTKTLGDGKPSAEARLFYIVWFILFFFVLLLVLNLIRAMAEAMRARVVVVYYPPPPDLSPRGPVRKFLRPLFYWTSRFYRWSVSLRIPLLTWADSFINLIQGKNQTMTSVLANTIIDQQRSIVGVADAIREDLNKVIDKKVFADQSSRHKPQHNVRVNISVLSIDQSNVFYISRTSESSRQSFPKRSMAWVTVFTGTIRWYLGKFLDEPRDIVLFDNKKNTIIADDDEIILLKTHYQARPGQDYQAFVMLPLPWPQRGSGTDYVKGAIHISFYDEDDFKCIWKNDAQGESPYELIVDETDPEKDPTKKRLKYPEHGEKMLEEWCDPEVGSALHLAIKALSELLHGFNEEIYRNYIEPAKPH